MTQHLEYDAVVAINRAYGGPGAGVADANGIMSAISKPAQTWAGADLYTTVWHKAACLLRGLAAAQYFHDGNKRTAYVCTETFLNLNGIALKRQSVIFDEVFVRGVAAGAIPLDKAAEWFATRRTWWSFKSGYVAPDDADAT